MAYQAGGGVPERTIKAIKSATVQTEIFDGFQVMRTMNLKETFDLYGRLTAAVAERHAHLTAADSAAAAAAAAAGMDHTDTGAAAAAAAKELLPPTMTEFNARLRDAKRSLSTLKTVWGTMLMQVPGLGPEIAGLGAFCLTRRPTHCKPSLLCHRTMRHA